MIKIYHIEARRSERIAWLLEEIGGIEYELDFLPQDVPGSLLRLEDVHEMRMTPIVQDGELIMIESGAIIEYLLSRYAPKSSLRPEPGSPAFPRYLEFMHFAEGSAMARILLDFIIAPTLEATGADYPMPRLPGLAGSRTESQRVMYFADNILGQRRYFAGDDFTAADIMMHFPLKMGAPISTKTKAVVADLYRTDHDYLDAYPNVKRFLQDMEQRPAFQRAVATTMPHGPPPM